MWITTHTPCPGHMKHLHSQNYLVSYYTNKIQLIKFRLLPSGRKDGSSQHYLRFSIHCWQISNAKTHITTQLIYTGSEQTEQQANSVAPKEKEPQQQDIVTIFQ